VAVGGSLLLAFCPLIWMYSIQAEVIYTPPVLVTLRRLLLWCVCLLAHKTCVGQEAGTPAASWCARDTLRRQAHQLPLGVQETHSGGRHTSCLLVCQEAGTPAASWFAKRHTAGTPAASWCARDTLPLGTQDWCRPLVQSQLVCLPPVALCLCACIICSCPGH
jgi:hypothetical protein